MALSLVSELGSNSPKTFPARLDANYTLIENDSASQDANILGLSGQLSALETLVSTISAAEIDMTDVATNIVPRTNNSFSIGTSALSFTELYVNGQSFTSVTTNLQNNIDSNYSTLVSTSGSLQENIDSMMATISGSILPVIQETNSALVSVSGTLQNNIDSNYSTLVSVSGTLYSLLVTTSGTLQENIDSMMVTISGSIIPVINQNYSTLVATSGILQSNINTNYSTLVSVSGTLYSNLANTSGALQTQLTFLESISGDWARKSLDNTFTGVNNFNNNVNVYDDVFIAGTLVVSGAIDISPTQTLISSVTDTYVCDTSGSFGTPGANVSWTTNRWANIFAPETLQINDATPNTDANTPYEVTGNMYLGDAPWLAFDSNRAAGPRFFGPKSCNYTASTYSSIGYFVSIDLGVATTIAAYKPTTQAGGSAAQCIALAGSNTGTFTGEQTLLHFSNVFPGRIVSGTKYTLATPGSYRYYRFYITTHYDYATGTTLFDLALYNGAYTTTDNTFPTIELIPNGTIKNISPSTLVLKDTTTGSNILGVGLVNVAYNKDGTGYTSLVDLETFRDLPNITSCSSFKIKIQPIGSQTIGYLSISTPSSSVSLKNDGTITNSVNNVPIFTVSSEGAVVASGTIVADNCYGRAIQISNIDSPYNLDTNYTTVRIVASGGPVVVNLPTAIGVEGRRYSFVSVYDQTTNDITISGGFSQTINNSPTISLKGIWENVSIESNGLNWNTIGQKNDTIRMNETTTIPNIFANSGTMFISGGALYFQGGSGTITLLAPT